MNDTIAHIKLKVKKWAEADWINMVNDEGKFEVHNRAGGIDYVLTKEEYFGDLEKVNSFCSLESWFISVMGEDLGGGFGMWLDEMLTIET